MVRPPFLHRRRPRPDLTTASREPGEVGGKPGWVYPAKDLDPAREHAPPVGDDVPAAREYRARLTEAQAAYAEHVANKALVDALPEHLKGQGLGQERSDWVASKYPHLAAEDPYFKQTASGERWGHAAADLTIPEAYPGARKLYDGAGQGSGGFDQVWEIDDELIVVECKSSAARLGAARDQANQRYQQGTPEYFHHILDKMEERAQDWGPTLPAAKDRYEQLGLHGPAENLRLDVLAKDLRSAAAQGRVQYVAVGPAATSTEHWFDKFSDPGRRPVLRERGHVRSWDRGSEDVPGAGRGRQRKAEPEPDAGFPRRDRGPARDPRDAGMRPTSRSWNDSGNNGARGTSPGQQHREAQARTSSSTPPQDRNLGEDRKHLGGDPQRSWAKPPPEPPPRQPAK